MSFDTVSSKLADLNELHLQVQAGKLTPTEAKEISDDMLSLDQIKTITSDLDEQARLVKAFDALQQIASAFFTVI